MSTQKLLSLLFLACLYTGCARSFSKPDLPAATYRPAGSPASPLDFDLSSEAVKFSEHFAKKLEKRNISLYVLRISNNTASTVWLEKEQLEISAKGEIIPPLPSEKVYKALRQPVAVHALWFLLGPFVRTEDEEKVIDYHPLGLAAAAWGIRNAVVAYQANQEAKKMLAASMPEGTVALAPSSTLYLLLPIPKQAAGASLELNYAGKNAEY